MKNLIFLTLFLLTITSGNVFADGATTSVLKDSAVGMGTGAAVGYGTAAAINSNPATASLSQKIGDFMQSPTGVMITSGIGAANSYIVRSAAVEESEMASNNIKKIEVLMQTFSDSWVDYCPNGRNDLKVPTCYCYLESGKKNTNRTNSETCKALWAKNDATNTATASSYNSTSTNAADVTGCLTSSGAFDEGCKCKRVTDSTGSNACKKVSSISATSGLGAAYLSDTGTNQLSNLVNQMASGNLGLNNLNGKNMAVSRTKQNYLNEKIIPQLNEQLKNKGLTLIPNSKELDSIQKKLISDKQLNQASNILGNYASLNPGPELVKAVKAVEQKTGLELSGTGKGSSKKEENKNFNLNFNDSSSGNSANNAIDIGNEQKVYKIKGDINKDSGASIFEVISNRYLESGIRRLFPDDK